MMIGALSLENGVHVCDPRLGERIIARVAFEAGWVIDARVSALGGVRIAVRNLTCPLTPMRTHANDDRSANAEIDGKVRLNSLGRGGLIMESAIESQYCI